MGKRAGNQIYVETTIGVGLDRLWQLSQDAVLHPRWDLRFSAIRPAGSVSRTLPEKENAPERAQQFRYEFRLPLHTIHGIGTSLGSRASTDGSATSVLKFASSDALSPIASGAGYWRYLPVDGGVRFITGYNYQPGWGAVGKVLDVRFIRPALGWATAVSFDRLRLWAEHGIDPGRARNAWLVDSAARAAGSCLAVFLLTKTAAVARPAAGRQRALLLAGSLLAAARWWPASRSVPRAARCSRTTRHTAYLRPPASLAPLREPA